MNKHVPTNYSNEKQVFKILTVLDEQFTYSFKIAFQEADPF